MGYELHITRAKRWTDAEAHPITDADWRACIASDPELELTGLAEAGSPPVLRYENPGLALWQGHPKGESVWFDLREGRVVVKNPDEPTIAKMISVAVKLGARVLGDDGEEYEAGGASPRPATLSLRERVASWLERLRPKPAPEPARLPFGVGDRVRDVYGHEAVVVAVDLDAEHGLGTVRVRFDDGRELSYAAAAHGLVPVSKDAGGAGGA